MKAEAGAGAYYVPFLPPCAMSFLGSKLLLCPERSAARSYASRAVGHVDCDSHEWWDCTRVHKGLMTAVQIVRDVGEGMVIQPNGRSAEIDQSIE